jgi:hypothetical protein
MWMVMMMMRWFSNDYQQKKKKRNVKHVTLHKFSIVTVIVVPLYAACTHNGGKRKRKSVRMIKRKNEKKSHTKGWINFPKFSYTLIFFPIRWRRPIWRSMHSGMPCFTHTRPQTFRRRNQCVYSHSSVFSVQRIYLARFVILVFFYIFISLVLDCDRRNVWKNNKIMHPLCSCCCHIRVT